MDERQQAQRKESDGQKEKGKFVSFSNFWMESLIIFYYTHFVRHKTKAADLDPMSIFCRGMNGLDIAIYLMMSYVIKLDRYQPYLILNFKEILQKLREYSPLLYRLEIARNFIFCVCFYSQIWQTILWFHEYLTKDGQQIRKVPLTSLIY